MHNCIRIFFAIAVIAFFVFTSRATFSNEEIIVLMDESGYKPNFLTVPMGTKVTWLNIGANPKWPASNFHPTHDLYPEKKGCIGSKFDACRALGVNEKFSFVFKRRGSWGVHDHLFPGITMTVSVGARGD